MSWLIFLLEILIPACELSSPAFPIMYSAYKLNKQGDSIQPWCTPFPTWNQPVVPRPVLTVASWSTYRFLRRQVEWSGIWTLVDYEGYSISSKGFLPTVVDIIFFWIKFTLSGHFSSLIPKMSVFTLAISCLTTSSCQLKKMYSLRVAS